MPIEAQTLAAEWQAQSGFGEEVAACRAGEGGVVDRAGIPIRQ
jgi:hypothetical protein